jgi:uncharacterized membrane protein
MSKWVKTAAVIIAGIAVVVLVYVILEAQAPGDETTHMGWGSHTYSNATMLTILGTIALIIIAVMFVIFRQEYKPLPPSMMRDVGPSTKSEKENPETPAPAPTKAAAPERAADKEYLVLRLLSGDERIMFRAIMDLGGEGLQKDLILRTKMSNAKVSRLLDKLQEKGVISKERYGSTNKVKIELRE